MGGLASSSHDFPDDNVALAFVGAGVIIRDAGKQVRDWSLGQGGSDGAASHPDHGAPEIPPGMRVARRGPKIAHAHRDGSLFIYFIAGGGGGQDVARSWEFWLAVQGHGRLETVSSMCYFDHSAHVTLMSLSSLSYPIFTSSRTRSCLSSLAYCLHVACHPVCEWGVQARADGFYAREGAGRRCTGTTSGSGHHKRPTTPAVITVPTRGKCVNSSQVQLFSRMSHSTVVIQAE